MRRSYFLKTNTSCNELTRKKSFNGRYSPFSTTAKKPGDLRNLRHRSEERKKKEEKKERQGEMKRKRNEETVTLPSNDTTTINVYTQSASAGVFLRTCAHACAAYHQSEESR